MTRPITKALYDFLSAVEMAHPGLAKGMTLSVPSDLLFALIGETPGAERDGTGVTLWGGALTVSLAGRVVDPRQCPVTEGCLLPPGHRTTCATRQTVEEQFAAIWNQTEVGDRIMQEQKTRVMQQHGPVGASVTDAMTKAKV